MYSSSSWNDCAEVALGKVGTGICDSGVQVPTSSAGCEAECHRSAAARSGAQEVAPFVDGPSQGRRGGGGSDGGGSGMQDELASSFLVCYQLRTWGKMMRACREDERSGER